MRKLGDNRRPAFEGGGRMRRPSCLNPRPQESRAREPADEALVAFLASLVSVYKLNKPTHTRRAEAGIPFTIPVLDACYATYRTMREFYANGGVVLILFCHGVGGIHEFLSLTGTIHSYTVHQSRFVNGRRNKRQWNSQYKRDAKKRNLL